MVIEIKRGGTAYHVQKELQIFAGKQSCQIALPISADMREWEDVREICVLMYRGDDEEKNVITVEDMVIGT